MYIIALKHKQIITNIIGIKNLINTQYSTLKYVSVWNSPKESGRLVTTHAKQLFYTQRTGRSLLNYSKQ